MTRIVVGVDGSVELDHGLVWALRRAVRTHAAVEALMAWEPLVYGADPTSGVVAVRPESLEASAQARLDTCVAASVSAVPGSSALVRARLQQGAASAVLERGARGADLAVLTARHVTATSRLLHGSVTSALLHHAACPVVVIPPAGADDAGRHGRVIVGYDETPAAQHAVDWATEEANERGLPLVPVYARPPLDDWRDPDRTLDEIDRGLLLRLTASAPGAKDLQPRVLCGEAGVEIAMMARANDLVVVGSRGRGELAGWLLGSTSTYVVRHAPCPVVVVRETRPNPATP